MESLSILYFFIALATTIIGAVPFGLVNLSVADTATKTNTRKSMEVASGATLVEVIFALAALLTGASLQNYLSSNHWVNFTVAGVLFGAGLIFWLKKYNKTTDKRILKEKANHKSIYSHFVECGSCGTHYHYIVNNRNQKWERKLLVCSKNRDRKTCENGSIFTSTFDEMIEAHCNYIIKNKSMFLEELHGKLKSHPMIISVQDNFKKLNQDINELKNAINIQKLNDEFDLYTMEEMQERLHKKELEQINLKNELLTTYNTEAIIMRYRKSLKPFKSRIESIEEFPFKEFFSKVIINNRNDINLILDPLNQNMKSNINIINTVEINYKIRQTNHKLISNLIMY